MGQPATVPKASRFAVRTGRNLVLPNTQYHQDRSKLGMVTVRPDPHSDYEYLLEQDTLAHAEHQEGLALLLAEYVLVSSGFARETLRALVQLTGVGPTAWFRHFESYARNAQADFYPALTRIFESVRRDVYFSFEHKAEVRKALLASREESERALVAFLAAQPEIARKL